MRELTQVSFAISGTFEHTQLKLALIHLAI
jgi:hypothetical protein